MFTADFCHLFRDTPKLPVSRNFVTSQIFIIVGTSLSGYALLNVFPAATDDFSVK
jgi:hypothetical protein